MMHQIITFMIHRCYHLCESIHIMYLSNLVCHSYSYICCQILRRILHLLSTMTCLFPMLERWLPKSGTHFFFSDLLTASNRVRSPPYLCIGTFSGEYHSVALFDSSGKYVPPMPGRILYHIWVNFLHSEFIPAWNTFE